MSREIRYSNQAYIFLRRLRTPLAKTLRRRILALERQPFPRGVRMLQGTGGMLRIRSGDHRILYTVSDRHVDIVRIDKRGRVYKR